MKQDGINRERRVFLKAGSLCLASTALAVGAGTSGAQPPRIAEADPQAQALGYRQDASRVDRKKQAKYRAGDQCSKCQFFSGKGSDFWGPCQIFGGKQVSAKGWCSAYARRP